MSDQPAADSASGGKQTFIGFAPPLLGPEPVRLPVVAAAEGLLALNLPGGLAADADPLNPQGAPLVAQALREQLAAGKPELARLGLKSVQSVFNLEPEMSGLALYAMSRRAAELWRNAYGSELLRLRFLLICERTPDLPDTLDCDLPIARHRDGGQMLVSHKSGKKTFTSFRRLAVAKMPKGRHNPLFEKELWEATATYMRPHQIRLHAHELGLRVCGEGHYAQVPSFYLSELKGLRRRLDGEALLWTQPMIHLAGVEPADDAGLARLSAEAARLDAMAGVGGIGAGAGDSEDADADAAGAACAKLRWPLAARLPRPLALAARLLFGEVADGL